MVRLDELDTIIRGFLNGRSLEWIKEVRGEKEKRLVQEILKIGRDYHIQWSYGDILIFATTDPFVQFEKCKADDLSIERLVGLENKQDSTHSFEDSSDLEEDFFDIETAETEKENIIDLMADPELIHRCFTLYHRYLANAVDGRLMECTGSVEEFLKLKGGNHQETVEKLKRLVLDPMIDAKRRYRDFILTLRNYMSEHEINDPKELREEYINKKFKERFPTLPDLMNLYYIPTINGSILLNIISAELSEGKSKEGYNGLKETIIAVAKARLPDIRKMHEPIYGVTQEAFAASPQHVDHTGLRGYVDRFFGLLHKIHL